MVRTLLNGTRQLRQSHHRNLKFTGKALERAGNFRNFLLTRFRAAARLHQLQIVDHDNGDIVLQLILTALAAHLGNGNTRRIINNQIGISDDRRALGKIGPVMFVKISVSKHLRIYM